MRIMVKGGVWKNTEDEILKAAVMKYGKNQWARISSLLTRKSAKQCKSRWYEWLDPSIKKTEWSREEEEKLLHLAKIMPNQWKTIAPIVGRTAAQCLEHYEKLLDAAQLKDENIESVEDPRRLRPGEIDPNPEAKPARPDPIDMDEDEKEMLSEARARLANTKGKKAKRKARERQLEEARRLASLQKRRELKAAGIELPKNRKKQKGIDYNAEIPFQKKPAPGFYEVDWEQETPNRPDFRTVAKELNEANKRKREEEEANDRSKKPKKRDDKKVPDAIVQINKLADQEKNKARSKLMLSAPTMDDDQLSEAFRIESGQDDVAEAALTAQEEGAAFTRSLLPSMGATPAMRGPSRTPMRTPAREDLVLKEAQNLVALTASQTPLAGGENPSLHASDFTKATPRRYEPKTPNALAMASSTPNPTGKRDFFTPMRTPARDSFTDKEDNARARAEKSAMVKSIQSGLRSLPKPQYDEYQAVLPEVEEDEEEADKKKDEDDDASELLSRQMKEIEVRENEKLALRSTALKREELPRPNIIPGAFANFKSQYKSEDLRKAEEMLQKEMILLISYEAVEYPFKQSKFRETDEIEDYQNGGISQKELEEARKLLEEETQKYKSEFYPKGFTNEEFDAAWKKCYTEEIYLPSQKKIGRLPSLQKEKIDVVSAELDVVKAAMEREAGKCSKIDQRIGVLFGGYQKRAGSLLTQISDVWAKIQESTIELECFKRLREIEKAAAPNRVNSLRVAVNEQLTRENENQKRYLNLVTEKENLLTK